MPQAYVKKVAKKHHKSAAATEESWQKAKRIAASQGHSGDYGYVTSIFKKMVGENMSYPTFKNFLILEADVETAPGQRFDLEPNVDDQSEVPSGDQQPDEQEPEMDQDTANSELDNDYMQADSEAPVDLNTDERFLELKHDMDPRAQALARNIESFAQTAHPREVEDKLQQTWEQQYKGKGVNMSGPDDMNHMGQSAPPAPAMGESLLSRLLSFK